MHGAVYAGLSYGLLLRWIFTTKYKCCSVHGGSDPYTDTGL